MADPNKQKVSQVIVIKRLCRKQPGYVNGKENWSGKKKKKKKNEVVKKKKDTDRAGKWEWVGEGQREEKKSKREEGLEMKKERREGGGRLGDFKSISNTISNLQYKTYKSRIHES